VSSFHCTLICFVDYYKIRPRVKDAPFATLFFTALQCSGFEVCECTALVQAVQRGVLLYVIIIIIIFISRYFCYFPFVDDFNIIRCMFASRVQRCIPTYNVQHRRRACVHRISAGAFRPGNYYYFFFFVCHINYHIYAVHQWHNLAARHKA